MVPNMVLILLNLAQTNPCRKPQNFGSLYLYYLQWYFSRILHKMIVMIRIHFKSYLLQFIYPKSKSISAVSLVSGRSRQNKCAGVSRLQSAFQTGQTSGLIPMTAK